MAHSLSAKKRIRQNSKRRAINRARRSTVRSKLRDCQEQVLHGTVDAAEKAIRAACLVLDREGSRNTVHRNAAARRKSRLMRKLNELKQRAAAAPSA
ncbi:MAG: 30S ribosomal protein S20 [Phycisphaerales bacterium]|nr:30S ribosomal protein S20 [Phycisphaerales bacterium]